ncbi:MAG TPA: ABC transporter permease [Actinomycetota bacterium]|nr:ABC transporter permease [Actinomycetota bacterium]
MRAAERTESLPRADAAARHAPAAAPRARRPVPMIVWQVALGLVIVAAWEGAASAGFVDPFFVSRPTDIAVRIWEWVSTGFVWQHLFVTLQEAFLAFAIGVGLGVVLGVLLARVDFLARLLEPYIHMLNAMPRVILAPILLLWFGLGIWSKVALGVTIVFFIVFFNTFRGVRDIDAVLVDNVRMLGATERQLVRHVLMPSALTWIFSSLQVSVGFAIVGAVVGEYLGASRGIGYLISQAEGVFDTTSVFAGMAVLMAVVVVVDWGVGRVERRLLRWKPDAPVRGRLAA